MWTAVCLLVGFRFFAMAVLLCFRPLSLIVPSGVFCLSFKMLPLLAKLKTRTVHGGSFVQLYMMLPIYFCGGRVMRVIQICTHFRESCSSHVFSCMAE